MWIGKTDEKDSSYQKYKEFVRQYSEMPRTKFLYADKNSFDGTELADYNPKQPFGFYVFEQGGFKHTYPHSKFTVKQAIQF